MILDEQGDAHVGGLLHHIARRHGHISPLVSVGDHVLVGRKARRRIHRGIGGHHARFEHGRHRNRLEDRTRLVGLGDRLERIGAHLRARRVGRVEIRRGGDGQKIARRGVHQHRASVFAADFLHSFGEALLEVALHVDVDRNHDVLPVLGGLVHLGAPGDRHARAAALHDQLARRAAQDVVVIQLQPRYTVAVHIDEPEHLARHLAVRVDALGVVDEVDPRKALLLQGVGRIHVGLALQVDEGGVFLQQVAVVVGRPAERIREGGGGRRDVFDLFRVGIDRGGVDARGEHVAVAVVDGPAMGGYVDVDRARRRGGLAVLGRLDHLQIHQAAHPDQSDGEKREQQQRQTARRRAVCSGVR